MQPKLDDAPLATMTPIEFTARDGMKINGYLTLPVGVPDKNLPLVLFVHGGPWGRDSWGFNPYAQLLANRGYAVLQINFRSSTGFGKKFLHAGDREWGLTMQNDLTDGVKWAVNQGVADPKRVAIFGGSYGGYAALAGAAFTPDLYRCAVDECGPSNLFTLLASLPPYWEVMRSIFFTRVGNPDDPKDKELLTAASPLFSADKIKVPMLVGQGANDPRVKPAEAEQIVDAIAKHRGNAVYVLYTDEGHGFVRPENRLDFTARMEKFLADNLGGRYEPMEGRSNSRLDRDSSRCAEPALTASCRCARSRFADQLCYENFTGCLIEESSRWLILDYSCFLLTMQFSRSNWLLRRKSVASSRYSFRNIRTYQPRERPRSPAEPNFRRSTGIRTIHSSRWALRLPSRKSSSSAREYVW